MFTGSLLLLSDEFADVVSDRIKHVAPLDFVVLHHAQLLPEESVLGLDILGMAFATTCKQSPSELCLAVMAGGSLTSTSLSPMEPYCVEVGFLQ